MSVFYRLLFRWRARRTATRLAAAEAEWYRTNPENTTNGAFHAFLDRVGA